MKKLFFLFSLILTIASCKKENDVIISSSLKEKINADATTHFIGESFGGGIVFYINATGKHGLIAAAEDLEEPSVWSYKDTITNAGYSKIGAGHFNTNTIWKVLGEPDAGLEDYAALECYEYTLGGYAYWFMPSKDELNEMYKQKNIIGGFKNFAYWSSTEISASKAWFQNFGTGQQVRASKIFSYAVRPIRYF